MEKQYIIFEDLGTIHYKAAWDYQEVLVRKELEVKSEVRKAEDKEQLAISNQQPANNSEQPAIPSFLNLPFTIDHSLTANHSPLTTPPTTTHHLLFCEHPPVYTLGKNGHPENVLLSQPEMEEKEIEFFRTNRGGDITFHGLQQVVGYPILDLEKFTIGIGEYLHRLEEVIILTIAEYGIKGGRSKGETGVWIEPEAPGKERKICAMGIRCSRWITMHGFALNVNTDLSYFDNIIPCGIVNKQVTSIKKELGYEVDFEEVKEKLKRNFESVFNAALH